MPIMKNGVKELRLKLGMSQSKFAKAINVRPSTVSNYENGIRMPDCKTAYMIIDVAKSAGINASLEDVYLRA